MLRRGLYGPESERRTNMIDVRKMLPHMKTSDRVTWAVLCWIFFNLLWLKFVESYIPQWIGAVIATALAVVFIVFGPGPSEAGSDEDEEELAQEEEREGE